mmetsp:Transcript_102871/g.320544  ORF Transcript_102871/g.320544 Transcript_102871/m.320544 type:complete len:212 (+) Transcript_102871:115-750(+)
MSSAGPYESATRRGGATSVMTTRLPPMEWDWQMLMAVSTVTRSKLFMDPSQSMHFCMPMSLWYAARDRHSCAKCSIVFLVGYAMPKSPAMPRLAKQMSAKSIIAQLTTMITMRKVKMKLSCVDIASDTSMKLPEVTAISSKKNTLIASKMLSSSVFHGQKRPRRRAYTTKLQATSIIWTFPSLLATIGETAMMSWRKLNTMPQYQRSGRKR